MALLSLIHAYIINFLQANSDSSSPTNTTQTPVILQQAQPSTTNLPGNIQIIQQIVTPTGEIQQIPVSNI